MCALVLHRGEENLCPSLFFNPKILKANGQIDHPDADTVFNAVISLEPVIDHVLTGIVDKKPAFAGM